jgi:hypothetical protein
MQDHDPEAVTELAALRFADAIAVPVFRPGLCAIIEP